MPALWRDMTDEEHAAAVAVGPGRVRYSPGSPPKSLARNLSAQAHCGRKITNKQADALWRLVWSYRRQIPDRQLVQLAEAKGGKEKARAGA